MTDFKAIYKNILTLAPELWSLRVGSALKSKVDGLMDLNLDVLQKEGNAMVIALSHYYKHESGDMIADPDMEIRLTKNGFAEALSYQDSYVYQRVYFDSNSLSPKLKESLNSFLEQWLRNCINQGHQLNKYKREKD